MEERHFLVRSRGNHKDAGFIETVNGRVRPVVETTDSRLRAIGTERSLEGAHGIRPDSVLNRKSGGKTAALQIS